MNRVLITTIPFAINDKKPLDMFDAAGIEYVINPLGKKPNEEELAEMIQDFDAVVAGTEPYTEYVLKKADRLKMIARVGVGVDSVPLNICRERNIMVSYTPDAVVDAVAELTVSFVFLSMRPILMMNSSMKNQIWQKLLGRELKEVVIGIIGLGKIGYKVAELLAPFKPKEILVYDVIDRSLAIENMTMNDCSIKQVDFDQVIKNVDLLTLHVPLSNDTKGMISKKELKKMKDSAFLINTSRGGIIDETSLHEAVKNNSISGAAIDVFEKEPYTGDLLELDNIIKTPHVGTFTSACRTTMEIQAVTDVVRFFQGDTLLNEVP